MTYAMRFSPGEAPRMVQTEPTIMGKKSRDKGKQGERECARLIAELTGWEVRRRVRQCEGESDLEFVGVPGWSVEVKRAAKPALNAWWRQTVEQAKAGEHPVLFYRIDRQQWVARWPLCVITEQRLDLDLWCETTLDTWATIAREEY